MFDFDNHEKGAEAVITTDPREIKNGSEEVVRELIQNMKGIGIDVICKMEVEEQFAVIDDEIVWHGGVNLLGKEDTWDNLMRIVDVDVAAELMEIALK